MGRGSKSRHRGSPPKWNCHQRVAAGQRRRICLRRGTGAHYTRARRGCALKSERWQARLAHRKSIRVLLPIRAFSRVGRKRCCYASRDATCDCRKWNANGRARFRKYRMPGFILRIWMDTSTFTCCRACLKLRCAWRSATASARFAFLTKHPLCARRSPAARRIIPPTVMKQGVQARVLKLLARDARALAERAGIATADYFCGIAQTGELTIEGMKHLLLSLPEGTTEVMCHPGYMDEELEKSATRLQDSRPAGGRDTYACGGQESCRFARYSPDRLWFLGTKSVKKLL